MTTPKFKLPPGWSVVPDFAHLDFCLQAPEPGGFITLSFKLRTYCFGLQRVTLESARRPFGTFTTKGWFQKMIDAAIEDLNRTNALYK